MKKRLLGAFLAVFVLVVSAVPALASGNEPVTADTVMTALGTGLTSAQVYAFQGINSALPIALGIAGVIIAVTIGYRLFKRMSK